MDNARLELLRRVALFGGVEPEIIELVLSRTTTVDVARGGYFFRQGELARSMFVLESGRVSILRSWEGSDYPIRSLEAGDCFGEMALIDMCPRSASIQALDDCRAIEVPGEALHAVYSVNLEQFTMIQMNMGREVSRRLRVTDQDLLQARMSATPLEPSPDADPSA